MKKIVSVLVIMLGILAGCGTAAATEPKEEISTGGEEIAKDEEASFPGEYTIPEGWVKAEEYSTEEKIFYVEEGHEKDVQPDNISINVGKNRYSIENHMEFKDAILRQLQSQLKGMDAQLMAYGSYTKQGYPIYTFTIVENSSEVVSRQSYIVGDYRYCMVYLTNYSGKDDPYRVLEDMVGSFVWTEETPEESEMAAQMKEAAEEPEQKNNVYSNTSIRLEYSKELDVEENRGEDGARVSFTRRGKEVFAFQQYEAWQIELELKDTAEEYQQDLETIYGYEDIEIVELSETTIGDYDAVKLVYSYMEENRKYITEKYYVVAGLVGFEFEYSYNAEIGNLYEEEIGEMLESVELTVEKSI